MASEIKVDTISEKTSANGVTIDGVSLKDSKIATANSVDSDAYVDGSIDTAHIGAAQITADKTSGVIRPNAKPIIINGDMAVAQRATSTASITSDGFHTLDRFETHISSLGTWTQSQDSDVPSGQGFANSLKMDCTTADASPSAGDFCIIRTKFEGQDLQLVKKGTANAEKLTLAFWVKSSKTGTHIVELFDIDNSRTISQAYTISSADTWEKKVVNFPADTTGAFGDDNGRSLDIQFWLGTGTTYSSGTLQTTWGGQSNGDRAVGQVNLADSDSNDFYITGIQLEVGEYTSSTIPPFQHESFGDNLARCQRYYQKSFDIGTAPAQNVGIQTGDLSFPSTKGASTASTLSQKYNFPVRMRASPAMTGYNSAASNAEVRDVSASADCSSTAFASNKETGFYVTCTSSGTTSVGNYLSLHFTAAAEL